MEKFRLSFEFNGLPYTAVIVGQGTPGQRSFSVTPVDGELERLLSGNAIIREVEGTLEAEVLVNQVEQTRLKLAIASRLSEYLKETCFAGDMCLMTHTHEANWEEFHPLLRHEGHHDASIY